jgi:pilus assembly protein Flp/PilA
MITRLYVRAQNLLSDAKGASAVEYGLLVAGIAAAIVAIVFVLGGQVDSAFTEVSSTISNN